MSEITRGVIGMPFDMAMGSDLSRRQFHSRAQSLLAEIERLRTAEGDAMTYKAGMENVAQQRDQLKAECEESAAVIDRLAKILAGVAVALKGEELPLHRHGYQDLAELVGILKLENDLRAAENETLRKSLTDIRENSSDLGACECAADALADSRKKAIQ